MFASNVRVLRLLFEGPAKQPALGRFLLPVAECTFALEQVLEDLQKDPWACQADVRVLRCTGTALTVALVRLLCFIMLLYHSLSITYYHEISHITSYYYH